MSLLQHLAQAIEGLDAARKLSPGGVLTGAVSSGAAMTLCDEGETRSMYDVAGVRTAVHAYGLHVRAVLLTQPERETVQALCEALCGQINAMALPAAESGAVVQDLHCGGMQPQACDNSGRYTWRVPVWMEVREESPKH